MALKKSLYQLLAVSPDASADAIKAAYDAHAERLANAITIEDRSHHAILRDAADILIDPARRKHYDETLREERIRALSSGMDEPRPRPANARVEDANPGESNWT